MPKLSIEDLKRIRKKAKTAGILSKNGSYNAKITVHMGTCGIAAGARKIMDTLMHEIERKEKHDIFLTTSGCAGLCSHEPMATVELAGETPVKYIDLTPDKAKKIFQKHIIDSQPVQEFVLAAGSERAI